MHNKNLVDASWPESGSPDNRLDINTALSVNRGIAIASLENLPSALAMMHAGGVPADICLRVLTDKSRRRASDWK